MEKATKRCFMYGFIAIALIVMLTATANAGSIDGLDYEDCTEFKEDCLDWECNGWFFGWCYSWRCIETQETCTESIPQTISDPDVDIDADTADYADTAGDADTVDGKHYSDIRKAWRIADKEKYRKVMENDARWSEDREGGGIGVGTVEKMLTGSYQYTYDYSDYNTYMLVQVTELLLMQQDEILCWFEVGIDASEFDLTHCMARKRAERTGLTQILPDGYECDAVMCVRFYDIPPEPTDSAEQIVSDNSDWKVEALTHWDSLCSRGIRKWCSIAAENRKEWGMD